MKVTTLVCAFVLAGLRLTAAQDTFTVVSGVTSIRLDTSQLATKGILVDLVRDTDSAGGPGGAGFIMLPKDRAAFTVSNGHIKPANQFLIPHVGGIVVSQRANVLRLNDFLISLGSNGRGSIVLPGQPPSPSLLDFGLDALQFTADREALILGETDLILVKAGADALGISDAAGLVVGKISFEASVRKDTSTPTGKASGSPSGSPDLTFCTLDSLRQFGRVGDVVGLSVSTTSWNIGNKRLDWYRYPDWRHPFIIRNLYRISDDKIEQVGESGAKHGFFALSDSQCGSGCNDPTDGKQLGLNCTDTYNTFTSADQGSLTPRYEINPWDGYFEPSTSHLKTSHPHDQVQHLLRVHDGDLDKNADYIVEAYYVHYQDTNPMNSSAWRRVKVSSGQPGGTWAFTIQNEDQPLPIGFAIDAWQNDQTKQTTIAEVNPPVKGKSPDGRSILAVKTRQLPNGTQWRYEYALLNVDMDRQISGFQIPIAPGVHVSDVTFHASEHQGEDYSSVGGVPTDNSPWAATVEGQVVSWRTQTNPLRWGNLYNFGFTADAGPSNTKVTVTLFKPGSKTSLSAATTGPSAP
jgi:hypothetical protein